MSCERKEDDGFRVGGRNGRVETTEIPTPSQEVKVRKALNGRKREGYTLTLILSGTQEGTRYP
jgi:hypothetical protein